MDLLWLEENLGVTYSSCKGGQVVLPKEKLQWLNEQTEDDGTTLLMKAAEEGDADCVELLLRCGVDVNESRRSNYVVRRAIDFAIQCDHRKVVEILLEWDSILPDSDSTSLIDKLKKMSEENEVIKKFFEERDKFHELIRTGDICEIERILKSREDDVNNSRCKHWVNSHGESSLYTAAEARKHEAWAFLLSRKFESLETETQQMEFWQNNNDRKKYDRAMAKYLFKVKNAHVFKLLSITKVRGESNENQLDIKKIYNDANKVPEAELLMKCLQFDSHVEVIFELERPDVKNVCSMGSTGVLGVMDPHLHRVYASARLETHAKVVSNLIHEFCHRVMYNVFMNNGMPYGENDKEMQNAYEEIFNKITSPENMQKCNPIIKKLKNYDKYLEQELIVRIPEIITEGTIGGKKGIEWNTEIEKELSKFYHDHVEKGIGECISLNNAKCGYFTLDIRSVASKYQKDYAKVVGKMQKMKRSENKFIYVRVSDLSLGISHIKKSLEDVVTVDLSFLMISKECFVTQLERGYFQNLIVVWDNDTQFSSNPDMCNLLESNFRDLEEYVTVLVRKEFKSCNEGECVDYKWTDLSKGTKDWILKQNVIFQGTDVVLQDLLEGLLSNMEADSTISTKIGPEDISLIIQQKKYDVGSNIESDLEKTIGEMLHGHPQTFFPRRTKVRPLAFDEELMKQRKMDAIFFLQTTEDELKEANVCKVRPWEGVKTQAKDVRHFFLKENLDAAERRKYCQKICKELRKVPNSDASWSYAHFFLREKQKKKNFTHILSERINGHRCVLLADVPGSGKSVYLHSEAKNEKLKNKDKWVEVVKLTECEDDFQKWMGAEQNLGVEDFLYQLTNRGKVNGKDLTLERALFSLFCHSEERVEVYFDGFDEICPKFKEIVSYFLKMLLDNTRVNFFVTTRTHQRYDLEMQLTTIAHSLVPFDIQEQVEFLNRQWNCMLKSLPEESRGKKIRDIAAKCKSLGYNVEEKILMENVGEGSNQDDLSRDYNLEKAAEFLIKKCKSHIENDAYFSEIPLHAYMMASESFENYLFSQSSLNIFSFFEKFVDLKKKLWYKKNIKEKIGQRLKSILHSELAKSFEQLKKFSVNSFSRESNCNQNVQELEIILSMGILVDREGSIDFIHGSFAEYFFCCQLFDEDTNIRDVLFKEVLLERKYETVRNFIDAKILSERSEENAIRNDRAKAIARFQSLLREGETYGISLCRGVFLQAILENHAGILQFLGAMPREYLSTVMFMDSNDDSSTFQEEERTELGSAFALFTEGINERMNKERPKYIMMHTMLEIAEMNNLIGDLGEYISKKGLRWTGVGMWDVPKMSHSKHFCWILEFFLKHKEALKEPLKKYLMGTEGDYYSQLASDDDTTFKAFRSLTDAILVEEDF